MAVSSVRRAPTPLLVGAAASWGLGTVLSKYALGGFVPAALLPVQLAVSVLALGAALLVTRERPTSVRRPWRIAALGVLNPGIAYALGLVGLSRIDASTSVVIWATEPVLIVVLAALVLHEPLTVVSVGCLVAAMSGIALIVGAPSSGAALGGVLLTLAAVVSCAVYSVVVRALHLVDGTLPVVWLQQVAALVFALLVYAVAAGPTGSVSAPTSVEAVAAALGGVFYYGLAFWLYVAGLRRTYASRAGMYLTLIPVFGLVFSAVLLGERFTAQQAVGAVVVIVAMLVLAIGEARRPAVLPAPEP